MKKETQETQPMMTQGPHVDPNFLKTLKNYGTVRNLNTFDGIKEQRAMEG